MIDRCFVTAFITGHSVRGCTGLSAEQREFQQRSGIPLERWLPYNFPYHASFPFPEPFNLATASLNNVLHYSRSRLASFSLAHHEAVAAVLQPYQKVVLLAGSCGLELLNNLRLPAELRQRMHVFAYGPVSRRRPEVASCCLVQGHRDWLSRFYHRSVNHRYECSHMGYLQHPETLMHFHDYCGRVFAA